MKQFFLERAKENYLNKDSTIILNNLFSKNKINEDKKDEKLE